MKLTIIPTDAALGARVAGVGLKYPPDPVTLEALEVALERFGVLIFPGQAIEPAEQVAFSKAFGPLVPTNNVDARLEEHPEIFVVGNAGGKIVSFAPIDDPNDLEWHADHMHLEHPARASMLYARTVPPEGGDTLFSCMYATYEALNAADREALERLTAIHSVSGLRRFLKEAGESESAEGRYASDTDLKVRWPLVRHHPTTGRPSLYFGSKVTIGIEGWDDAEARSLIGRLTALAAAPERVYRHVWRQGDAVLWDNRRVLHAATPVDLHRYERVMHRTTFVETEPIH